MAGSCERSGSSDETEFISSLRKFLGKRLVSMKRVFFVHQSHINRREGAVEFDFSSSEVLLLTAGADGETLAISERAWEDPFDASGSGEDARWIEQNTRWVAEHGKWELFDVSSEAPYVSLLGATLTSVQLLHTIDRKIGGLRFTFTSVTFDVVCGADETIVVTNPSDISLGRFRLRAGRTLAHGE